MAIKITCKKNGPYRVEGDLSQLELVDADGNKYDLTGKPGISLCRCGGYQLVYVQLQSLFPCQKPNFAIL